MDSLDTVTDTVDLDVDPEDLAHAERIKKQEEQEFLETMHNLMMQLTDSCRGEFEMALQTQDMGSLSESCKEELTVAAQNTQGFEETQRRAAKRAAAEMMVPTDSNAVYYFVAFIVVAVAAAIGYIIWVNKKLHEAGYYKESKKKLSKKKAAKERMKGQKQQ